MLIGTAEIEKCIVYQRVLNIFNIVFNTRNGDIFS